jgi:class 3 adenylate cyclase
MLDLALRPPGPTMDLSDFAATEPDPALVRRIWSALGLPESEGSTIRVTPDAAQALRTLTELVALLGEQVTLGVARVVGSSMARLAETISNSFRVAVELPNLGRGTNPADISQNYASRAPDVILPFVDAMGAVFLRHLIDASYQTWSTDEERAAVTHQRTICFADLVGSTEAFHAMSVRQMGDMVRRFEEQVWELVGARGGRVVKLIGDEAMFVVEDPAHACRIGLDLIRLSEDPVRVGMAYGTVVGLYGDYYGQIVNLAARLVTAADPSSVVVNAAVRDGAGADAGLAFAPMEPVALKGFADAVPLFRVTGTDGGAGADIGSFTEGPTSR